MKTIVQLIALAALTAVMAFADPLVLGTIYDPFPGTTCTSGCDVIGELGAFDIQKVQLLQDTGTFTVAIYTNYDHKIAPPDPWADAGLTLNIGDFFFAFDDVLTYGIALKAGGHGGFEQDGLYKIGGAVGTKTAQQVLGNPSGVTYRKTSPVWLGGTAPADPIAQGTHSVVVGGNGTTSAKWIISVTFQSPALNDLWSTMAAHNGEVGVYFASATCGNDIISGSTVVPEPGTGVLVLGGALIAWCGRRLLGARRRV